MGFRSAKTKMASRFLGTPANASPIFPCQSKKVLKTISEKKLAPVRSCKSVISVKLNLKAVATVDHMATANKA